MPNDVQPVQGPDGKLYQFPSGTTKDAAIAYFKKKGIGVSATKKQTFKESESVLAKENAPIAGTYRKMGRGIALGAAEGLGIPETQSPLKDIVSSFGAQGAEQQAHPLKTLGMAALGPAPQLYGLAKDEFSSGKEAVGGLVEGDPEKFGHGASAFLTRLLMLKGLKEGTTGKISESPLVKAAEKTGKFARDVAKPKVSMMAEEHAAEARQAEMKYQKELADHRENVQAIKAQHERAKTEFKTAEDLKQHQQDLAQTVSENVKLADRRIGQEIGAEFNAVNEAIEKKNPQATITDAEREARGKLFFPDSVQAFNNIVGNVESKLGMTDFSILRKTYTRLNDVLYGGRELPSDLYSAVKTVRDSLGKDLQSAATKAGMGERFRQAMKNWSDYQSDWHDTAAIAKGGSPLSKIIAAEDPQFVIDQLGGKAGQRLVETLAKYGKYGADSGLAQRLRDFSSRLKKMPLPKAAPEAPKIPAAPEKPSVEPFNREAASRKLLIDRVRSAMKLGLFGGGGAYLYEKLLGGKEGPTVP